MTDDVRDAKCPECQATQKRFEEISLKYAADSVDWADAEDAIRDLCRPVLGGAAVDGDSHGVPPLVEIVKATIEKLMAAHPLSLLKRLDELRPQMDGPGWLARDAERDIITFFLRDAWNIPPATEVKP